MTVLLFKPPVVTRSDRLPAHVMRDTVIGTVIWVALIKVMAPMEMPVTGVTRTVVVGVKLLPLMVTVVVAPRGIALGEIEVITGAGAVTVKVRALLVPPGVVTDTLCAPMVALAAMINVALTEVAVDVTPVAVMSEGRLRVAPLRRVPVKVTETLVPCVPELGLMALSVGTPGVIVNVTALLVPPGVVTVMF